MVEVHFGFQKLNMTTAEAESGFFISKASCKGLARKRFESTHVVKLTTMTGDVLFWFCNDT